MTPQDLSMMILTRSQVETMATMDDYIAAMEDAFLNYAKGNTIGTGMLHFDSTGDVEFHLKAGGLILDTTYFGLKNNGSSFTNAKDRGLPNIIGAILLCDGTNGRPLAIIDSIGITINRTGATTAVAAKYLARKDSRVMTICGCGTQGKIHARALKTVLPGIDTINAHDQDKAVAVKFAKDVEEELGVDVVPVGDSLKATVQQSDVLITCTPSRQPFILDDFIAPGTFIGAVGADSPDKQELDVKLLGRSKVVVDITDQCARVGELHHAIEAGIMQAGDIHGEIGAVIMGKIPGRTSDEEVTIYDATGTALQDVAAAAMCYKKALQAGTGTRVNLYD